MEAVGVYPAAPDPGVGDAPAMQVFLVNARWAENPVSLSIKPAEVPPASAHRPIHTVASRVELVVGVGRGDEGEIELPCDLETGEAEGEFSGHVDYVGAEAGGVIQDVAKARKGPLDIGIEEQGNTGRPMHLRPVRLPLGQGVVGGVDPDLMAALLQGPRESKQRDSHAADHGPVHLGKQGDAHRVTLGQHPAGDKVGRAVGYRLWAVGLLRENGELSVLDQ